MLVSGQTLLTRDMQGNKPALDGRQASFRLYRVCNMCSMAPATRACMAEKGDNYLLWHTSSITCLVMKVGPNFFLCSHVCTTIAKHAD